MPRFANNEERLRHRLARMSDFTESCHHHIPALIAGDRASPEWQAAVEWWQKCSVNVTTSTL